MEKYKQGIIECTKLLQGSDFLKEKLAPMVIVSDSVAKNEDMSFYILYFYNRESKLLKKFEFDKDGVKKENFYKAFGILQDLVEL